MTPIAPATPKSQSLIHTLGAVWTLLFGIGLLMLANGLQGSLLGVRAEAEGFDAAVTGLVMSGFFVGLLAGSVWTPRAISLVGHVRVFAAMSAIASVSILLHALFIDEFVWWAIRFVTGFCYAGVFVVAESWLNERAPKGKRGQLLALYMVVTFTGMGAGQFLLTLADSREAVLFILVSVLISLAAVPLLLLSAPLPMIEARRAITLRRLAAAAPLGVFGIFVSGIANGTIFGMGAVYARSAGFTVSDTASFMALLIIGAAILQWPIGRLSDVFDRRIVLFLVTSAAAVVSLFATSIDGISSPGAIALVSALGGLSLSLYSLSLAFTNDYLEPEEMVGASSGLVLILGIGSVIGPIVVGAALEVFGSPGFFLWLTVNHASLAVFALWRMMRHAPLPDDQQAPYVLAPLQGTEIATAVAEDMRFTPGDDHTQTSDRAT